MAPESERAKRADVPFCKHCGFKLGDHHNDVCQYWGQVLPSECIYIAALDNHSTQPAPASCSEVVERLAHVVEGQYVTDIHGNEPVYSAHNETMKEIAASVREQAPAILHSWRERRVQELEELLREMVKQHGVHSGECFSCDYFVRETGRHNAACLIPKAEALLANSEQIRKGAKHE